MSNESTGRIHTFERWFNVRDLGGLPGAGGRVTEAGRLFRSGVPGRLTASDQVQARALGIRTVIDLRRDNELRDRPHPLLAFGAEQRRANLQASQDTPGGASSDPEITPERYMRYLDSGAGAVRDIFTWLGDQAIYPAVVHCAAGTHRTAVIAALALDLLGTPHEAIEGDYLLSIPESERLLASWAERGWFPDASAEQSEQLIAVRPGVIGGFLDLVAGRYGSTEGYLRDLGVTAGAIEGFRRALLA